MSKLANFVKKNRVVLGSVVLLATCNAQAALSTEAQAAADAVSTAANDWVGEGWKIAIVTVVGFAGIGLFRKAISRAT